MPDGADPPTAAEPPPNCPACGRPHHGGPVYQIGQVPVHDVQILRSREAAITCCRGDIRLAHCNGCGFIWNRAFDPDLLDYALDYESTQAFSPTFTRFHERLARDLIERYGLRNKKIIEIGCGQGEFLTLLCDFGGNQGVGFDPAYTGDLKSKGITVIPEVYGQTRGPRDADFLCCKMTLEHIQDTRAFLRTVRDTLESSRDVTVFFQIPEVTRILRECAFWDIFYEHCSYFSPGSLARVFRAADFEVTDIWRDYGDQYLMIEARPGLGTAQPLALEESPQELAQDVQAFRDGVRRDRNLWLSWLSTVRDGGERIALWGGGSKAVAFLSALGPREEVVCAVDINPRKANTFLAGAGQVIIQPDDLPGFSPDYVLVMNPVYRDEVADDLFRLGLAPTLLTVEPETCARLAIRS